MSDTPSTPVAELHSSLFNELRRTPTATLEPTLTLERDSLGSIFFFFFFFFFFSFSLFFSSFSANLVGSTHLINVHDPRGSSESGEEEVDKGVRVYSAVMEEPVQDNCYELRLDFDRMSFVYVNRRIAYEGGDGFYETLHRGTFSKEMSGTKRSSNSPGNSSGPLKRASAKKSSSSPPMSGREPTVYFLCKVESRDFESDWQPWDKRMAPERVVRKGDTFHQELLFRCVANNTEVWNDNVAPAFVMTKKTQQQL